MRIRFFPIALLFITFLICPSLVIGEEKDVTSTVISTPNDIDPYAEDVSEFFKTNLNTYRYIAGKYYKSGDYYKAAQHFLYVLRFRMNDETVLYNLACCYGKLNKPKLAAEYLLKAFNAGFDDKLLIENDEDFKDVRTNTVFSTTVSKICNVLDKFGEKAYFSASILKQGRIHLPENYDENIAYPVVIALHGFGGDAEGMALAWNMFKKRQFIFVVPEGPYETYIPGVKKGFSWYYRTTDKKLWKIADPLASQYIEGVIDQVRKKYKVSKLFLLGFSQGVSAAYQTAFNHKDKCSGVIAYAGLLPDSDVVSDEIVKAASGLRIFIGYGNKDSKTVIKSAKEAKEKLEKFGFDVEYHEGVGGHHMEQPIVNKMEEWIYR